VEQGTHDELLRLGGHYERLWRHQSGGFIGHDFVPTETATELPDEPPVDELRADTKPEPSVEDAPVVARA
jgi:ATP-binding cassette subfamily B multidrug efflux pump